MSNLKSKKIAVLLGGLSSEREISLRSGAAIASALEKLAYNVVRIDVQKDVAQKLLEEKVALAFIALHGKYGEDGAVQGLLEMMQIPYTGSGILASALAMDKVLTKRLLMERAFLTPGFAELDLGQVNGPLTLALSLKGRGDISSFVEKFSMNFPVIVKPAREGSTIGMSIVREKDQLQKALEESARFDEKILVEEFIQGTEVTCGVLNGEPLPLIEVVPKSGFYDFQSKYTKGATEYILPARVSAELTQEIQETTVQIYRELGCEGCARADYIIDSEGRFYFLEINTIPGMTETSLIPKAAASVGLSFENLVEKILVSSRLKLSKNV
ncbi:MAG: D-alanine--D-alanine ligase [Deltaproteobacteria bacterium]|nr:D-alanine--D-alanine ligase [Deltaproteobacteria bacterium]